MEDRKKIKKIVKEQQFLNFSERTQVSKNNKNFLKEQQFTSESAFNRMTGDVQKKGIQKINLA
jgi:hypothetical protein